MKTRDILWITTLSSAIIIAIDALTNTLDIQKYSWDFRYYIDLAERGFNAKPLVSPFAYRYLTPFLAGGISQLFGISVENGFRALAYAGALLQLLGVFMFVNRFTQSQKGAYIALLVTAFSLFNVKFLLFDVYRPDHLAYAFILIQSYFCIQRKFFPLFLTTIVASQIREFAVIPLIAYLFAFVPAKDRVNFLKHAAFSALCLFISIVIPRMFIPVTGSFQFVDLSVYGIARALIAPLLLTRDLNFIYSILAYLLPTIMIVNLKDLKLAFAPFSREVKLFLIFYTLLVLAMSFYGGTDFYRFTTYLFLPQILIVGLVSRTTPIGELLLMITATFIFNRIWLPFPIWDINKYLDFYGAFALRINRATLLHFAEWAALAGIGVIARRLRFYPAFRQTPT